MIYCDEWAAVNKQQASRPSVHTNKQTKKQEADKQTVSKSDDQCLKVINHNLQAEIQWEFS